MARFARIDSQIRANRLILAIRFRALEPEPLFCESRFGGAKIANRRFEAIRANRSHVLKIGLFLRIDLRESIRTNRPDSRCESPGHLSYLMHSGPCQLSKILGGNLIFGIGPPA